MTDRIQVVGGGELAPEELAALVVALTPVAPFQDEGPDGVEPVWHAPAWGVAALLEGVGGAPLSSHADLTGRLGPP